MSKSFLQSKEWARFQESLGRKVYIVEDKVVIKYGLPLGLSYLYSPRPHLPEGRTFKKFLREAQKIAKKENAIFLRLEPDLINNVTIKQLNPSTTLPREYPLENTRGRSGQVRTGNLTIKQCSNIQPANTLVLDLTKPLDKILEEMHPKTRYNIRLAERHNLKTKKSADVKDIDIFWRLALKTSRRDGFSYHPKRYYQKMLETLGRKNKKVGGIKGKIRSKKELEVVLFIAQLPDPTSKQASHDYKPSALSVAAILVLFYQDTAIYLHGASDHTQRRYMAPFLLQWRAIKEAKKRGCKTYDFWGVAPNNSTMKQFNHGTIDRHSWAGITRFKTGFAQNGKIINYPSCYDIIYQRFWYLLYKLTKKIKSL